MNMKHLKVLIVEDEPAISFIHRALLENMGHHADVAETGGKAIEMAGKQYDAILLDMGLPDMTGIQVAATIRRCDSQQKYHHIIALSAYSISELQAECRTVGINKIITKPVAPHILENALNTLL